MKEYKKLSKTDYIRIANYYYNHGLTQEQIATSMDLSRQRINRVLSKCLETGIVKITVEGVEETTLELENALEKKYGLKAVRICKIFPGEDVYPEVGKLAAEYLSKLIQTGDIIGFSRGRSISALVDSMPELTFPDLTVTQLMGGCNNEQARINVDDIIHRFALKTNAKSAPLFAPVIVNSAEARKAITEEQFFKTAYKTIKSSTIAVVGIGDASYEPDISLNETNQIEFEDGLLPAGEICTNYYTIDGRPVSTSIDDKKIAVSRDDFIKIPVRIGVAGSKSKIPAILGAIRGGYINTLVTDTETAEALI